MATPYDQYLQYLQAPQTPGQNSQWSYTSVSPLQQQQGQPQAASGGGAYSPQVIPTPGGGASYVAGGSGWMGQNLDLMQLAQSRYATDQSAGLAREELEFKKWAAEQGFEIDKMNLAWLKEQFYRQKAMDMYQQTGYMPTSPLEMFGFADPNQRQANSEEEARRMLWEAKRDIRKKYGGKEYDKNPEKATDAQIQQWVGQFIKDEERNSALEYGHNEGYFKGVGMGAPSLTTTPGTGEGAYGEYAQAGEGFTKTLERDVAEWNKTLQEQGLGLNYLQLLSSLRGPRDWLQYGNVTRAAQDQGSAVPGWAQALVGQQSLAAFQGQGTPQGYWNTPGMSPGQALLTPYSGGGGAMGGGGTTPGEVSGQAALPQQAQWAAPQDYQGRGGVAPVPMGGQQQALPTDWMQQLAQNPHGISYSQWQNMLPFETQMLQGALEQQGVDPDTWVEMMRRSWAPRQTAVGTSSWNIS